MEAQEIKDIIEKAVKKAVNKSLRKSISEEQQKYIQMTDDLLRQYGSRKAFLDSAMQHEEYANMPAELVKEYTRKVKNARFLTAVIDDALKGIQGKEQREVIDLIYFQHKTISQITDQLYCCNNSVLRWKQRALLDMAICIFGVDAVGLEEI